MSSSKINPYTAKIFGQVTIWFRKPQKGVSQDRRYLWTGSGLKPEERVSRPKTFGSEKEARAEIKNVVIPHIKNYKTELERYIKESALSKARALLESTSPPFKNAKTALSKVRPTEDPEDTANVFVKALIRDHKVAEYFHGLKAFDIKYRLRDFVKAVLPSWLRRHDAEDSRAAVSKEIMQHIPAFKKSR